MLPISNISLELLTSRESDPLIATRDQGRSAVATCGSTVVGMVSERSSASHTFRDRIFC
jgi:hypothetical protein